jgi:hypothetical protein
MALFEKTYYTVAQAIGIFQPTLPDYENSPAEVPQAAAVGGVARLVAVQFGLPVGPIGTGPVLAGAARVSVPKAAVHEDDAAAGGENQIGTARQVAAMESVAETQAVDHTADSHFGLGVFAPNAAHHGAALGRSENVHYDDLGLRLL